MTKGPGRPATGQLIWRKSGWYARFTTTIDGERIRVCRALATKNAAVAKRKLARLLEAEAPDVALNTPETFSQAAQRVYETLIAARPRSKGPKQELSQLKRLAFPVIGDIPVAAVRTTDVNRVLDNGQAQELSRQSVQHLRQRVSNVFAALQRAGSIEGNPARGATMPKFAEAVVKERAVLTDNELAEYLAWEHPEERHRDAVRERQTMACVSRMFGGLRTGDLHALRWDAFDVESGRFQWGYAPRQKTRRPQKLAVPAMLRPFLRDWWERAGRPRDGFVFPVRRIGRNGDRVGKARNGASHAHAFRRDLRRVFGIEVYRDGEWVQAVQREGYTKRQAEVFTETAFTLPVDFHSWRRSFVQSLADAEVNAQQAAALAGHADLGAHMRYLRNAERMRSVPDAALPALVHASGVSAARMPNPGVAAVNPNENEALAVASERATGLEPATFSLGS